MKYILFLLAVFVACSESTSRTPLDNGIDKASFNMLKETYVKSPNTNVIISPLGIILLLALYSSGTEGVSKQEIMTFLGSSNYEELTKSYMGLSVDLHSIHANFTFASKVYVARGFSILDNFLDSVNHYKSEIDILDFAQPGAVDVINRWAFEKTRGYIKDPLKANSINKNTAVALFNVIFFQGHWNVLFKKEKTQHRDFHANKNAIVKKPMMNVEAKFLYLEAKEINARLLEIPYNETSFRMVVFLPDEVDGLASVLDKVAEKGVLDHVLSMARTNTPVDLYMPKFEIKSQVDFKPVLSRLGVKDIFNTIPGAPGIVKESNVSVSEIFQDAFIKVNEEGSTAGAFSGITALVRPHIELKRIVFAVDRPFLFTILRNNVVLFAGTYSV